VLRSLLLGAEETMSSIEVIEALNDSERRAAFAIRRKVFVDEQRVEESEEWDDYDSTAPHLLALANGFPAGTARYRETDKGIKIERMAVLRKFRNQGVGSEIMRRLIEKLVPLGKPIYLHAQMTAYDFYQMHGFVEVGDEFMEANIPHISMEYQPK